jgi:hypothetical protein
MNLSPVLKHRYLDANGAPLAGGKLYSYVSGTTTPQATYTDAGGLTPNANPVVLDANGEANIWLDPASSYKFILKDSTDVSQWTVDGVVGLLAPGAVVTDSVADGAVTTAKIANDAVDSTKLKDSASVDADRAVTTNHIRDSAVTAAKIASDAVTTVKIVDANVTTAKIADAAITQAKRAALGQQISSSCGTFDGTYGSATDVTNLSINITTTGRPVFIGLISDSAAATIGSAAGTLTVAILRGITTVHTSQTISTKASASSIMHIDVPAAGTYTYKVQISGSSVVFKNCQLVAFEL